MNEDIGMGGVCDLTGLWSFFMETLFSAAFYKASAFNSDVGRWDVSKVSDLSSSKCSEGMSLMGDERGGCRWIGRKSKETDMGGLKGRNGRRGGMEISFHVLNDFVVDLDWCSIIFFITFSFFILTGKWVIVSEKLANSECECTGLVK